MSISFLESALNNSNIQAVLSTIRHSEGTACPEGYNFIFGSTAANKLRNMDLSKHPNIKTHYTNKAGKDIITTAAGAYQIIHGTWEALRVKLSLPDFSPHSQDLAAVELLSQINCVQKIMEGDFHFFLNAAKNVWASLPGAGANQPEQSLAKVTTWYQEAGGVIA